VTSAVGTAPATAGKHSLRFVLDREVCKVNTYPGREHVTSDLPPREKHAQNPLTKKVLVDTIMQSVKRNPVVVFKEGFAGQVLRAEDLLTKCRHGIDFQLDVLEQSRLQSMAIAGARITLAPTLFQLPTLWLRQGLYVAGS
jgi:hypothetical protein